MRTIQRIITATTGLMFLGSAPALAQDDASSALPNAKPGECYAKVMVPPIYSTETQTVVVRDASQKVQIVPAKYELGEERVLVSEPSTKLVPVAAVYGTETEVVEVRPRTVGWVAGSLASSVEVNPAVLRAAASGGVNLDGAPVGQCFHEHFQAAKYDTKTERILVREASEKVSTAPAKYEFVEQRVMTKPASKKLVEVPAVYESVKEKVLVEPAKTVWKKGRGPIQKVDNSTGEIMCLVEVPAVYKTVTKRVLKTAASTKTIEIPAQYETVRVRKLVEDSREIRTALPAEYREVAKQVKVAEPQYVWHEVHTAGDFGPKTGNVVCKREHAAKTKTITRRVVKQPATFKKVEIPAKYETRRVRKLLSDAREVRTEIPAETRQVSKRVKQSDAKLEWRPVLCETNMSTDLVARVQSALKRAGYDPGPVDGVIGRGTLSAVDRFQRAKGLPSGGLTLKTLEALNVQI